jgi:hypothetical protein
MFRAVYYSMEGLRRIQLSMMNEVVTNGIILILLPLGGIFVGAVLARQLLASACLNAACKVPRMVRGSAVQLMRCN